MSMHTLEAQVLCGAGLGAGAGAGGGLLALDCTTFYKKYLLNRLTATPQFQTFLQATRSREDEDMQHVFHKIMIHSWRESRTDLFKTISDYFSTSFMPVNYVEDDEFCSFYTDSLSIIHKIIGFEFIFPYKRTMFNIDILFNDKTSTEFYGNKITTEQLISGIVSRRFTNKLELNLERFSNDEVLCEKKIHVYSIQQLALYKRLMLRMGRDTKLLNLSSNNLKQVPMEIMNFFLKGDLIGVNLSDNDIKSLSDLNRMSSKLEKLWLEGNPLCEEEEFFTYVKAVALKFPRLKQLDGVRINQHGFVYPFWKNFLVCPSADMIAEKFLTLYFSHYDSSPRSNMASFYDPECASFSISHSLSETELNDSKHYRSFARNFCVKDESSIYPLIHKEIYSTNTIFNVFRQLPETTHDPTTFTVDVTTYDKVTFVITVDGVFKERRQDMNKKVRIYKFRRTFYIKGEKYSFFIRNEMLHISHASLEEIKYAFNSPIRKLNELSLLNPSDEEKRTISIAFAHLSNLKWKEVDRRLRIHDWDLRKALITFEHDLRNNMLSTDSFLSNGLEEVSDDDID